jgi:hypothetical protein
MDIRAGKTPRRVAGVIAALAVVMVHGVCLAQAGKGAQNAPSASQGMQKIVTQQASFVQEPQVQRTNAARRLEGSLGAPHPVRPGIVRND